MIDSYEYFKDSSFNFIIQYDLLNLFNRIDNKINDFQHCSERDASNFLYNEIIELQINVCNIIFSNIEINKENLDEYHSQAIDLFNQTFLFDKTLKKYLCIEDDTEEEIEKDLLDNFHKYLLFYSKLNLSEEVKKKLDIKNIRILKNIEEKQKALSLLDDFANLMYACIIPMNGITEDIKEYKLDLMKKAGIYSKDTKYSKIDNIIETEQERLNKMTDKEKKKEEEKKKIRKERFFSFLKKIQNKDTPISVKNE